MRITMTRFHVAAFAILAVAVLGVMFLIRPWFQGFSTIAGGLLCLMTAVAILGVVIIIVWVIVEIINFRSMKAY